MKTLQSSFRTGLLCALTIVLFNCKKDTVDTTIPTWNYSTFTDARDGKTYKYIKIGNQNWMAENLAFKTNSGSWTFYGSEENGTKYGRLYTWNAAKEAIPAGWHLPTDNEWKQLEMSLGMSQTDADSNGLRGTNEGEKLKSLKDWAENGNGTDVVGFNALPGGFLTNSGSFFALTWYGYWWTATESTDLNAWFRYISNIDPKIYRKAGFKEDGYSIRCIKD